MPGGVGAQQFFSAVMALCVLLALLPRVSPWAARRRGAFGWAAGAVLALGLAAALWLVVTR